MVKYLTFNKNITEANGTVSTEKIDLGFEMRITTKKLFNSHSNLKLDKLIKNVSNYILNLNDSDENSIKPQLDLGGMMSFNLTDEYDYIVNYLVNALYIDENGNQNESTYNKAKEMNLGQYFKSLNDVMVLMELVYEQSGANKSASFAQAEKKIQ